jgi:hypothetical protein
MAFAGVLAVCVAVVALRVHSAVPALLNYQGTLTSVSSGPVNNASLPMTFRLYTGATGGVPVYSEAQNVNVANGLFNVRIGEGTPISLPFDTPYFLGISAGSDAEMTPRQPLSSNAFAFRAAVAESLVGSVTIPAANITGAIAGATIPLANITGMLAGSVSNIAPGSGFQAGPINSSGTLNLASTQLLPAAACALNEIPKWNGSAWGCATDAGPPPGGAAGQALAGSAMGPVWSASPSLTTLALSGPLALSGLSVITLNGSRFIRTNGDYLFAGLNAGPPVYGGSSSTALGTATMTNADENVATATAAGYFALNALTTGPFSTAVGTMAMAGNTVGLRNTAVGANAVPFGLGSYNAAFGAYTGSTYGQGDENTMAGGDAMRQALNSNGETAIGFGALFYSDSGGGKVAVGKDSLRGPRILPRPFNTAAGEGALGAASTGVRNTAIGRLALAALTTGSDNVAIGVNAGPGITAGSNNVLIGNTSAGNLSNSLRVGSTQTATFIAGIRGSNPGGQTQLVGINAAGRLGTNAALSGVGTDNPENVLHVVGNISANGQPQNHVMQVTNSSTGSSPDVLALRVRSPNNVGGGVNFISFFNGNYVDGTMGASDQSLGSIQGNGAGGVTFAGPGNDFAEYVPKLDPDVPMAPGEVVGIVGGKVTREISGAERLAVVSTSAIVTGNDPGETRRGAFALIAFIGQADVKVLGLVRAGDYLIAEGNRAIAVPPGAMQSSMVPLFVGRAWASSDEPGEKPVRAAIGIERGERQVREALSKVREEQRRLKTELETIKQVVGLK